VRVVVTGADGFIGGPTCELFEQRGHHVRRVVRSEQGPGHERMTVPDLVALREWSPILQGAEAVVHLAGRAHVVRETGDPTEEFRRHNVDVTRRLLDAAIACGVRRFVFVSSIGVNGSSTPARPFVETDEPNPSEPYARSKLECEQLVRSIAQPAALEFAIVRPPLVYGPEAKGNLQRMIRLVASGVPLPLASVQNRRNLLAVDNLAEVLVRCVELPAAANQTFLVAEPDIHSTPEIFAALYAGMARRNRLFHFPVNLLRNTARLLGSAATFDKLCSSLEVNAAKAYRELDWQPRRLFEQVMAATARQYLQRRPE
jgi:UDP-N-acetyl-alpha-D-quinovosamine dehydrogenase